MSLSKILMAPAKLFKKENISFLIIRRYDAGVRNDDLRYVSVKPSASISVLRQKVWHLLDLPDFCEETIILKANDTEIPLTALRKGNDPKKPFILEVWPPNNLSVHNSDPVEHWCSYDISFLIIRQYDAGAFKHNMLTMGSESPSRDTSIAECEQKTQEPRSECKDTETAQSPTLMTPNQFRPQTANILSPEYKTSELSCKVSSSTLLWKLHGRKNRDNIATVLLKIQNDLANLSNKLSTLEDKIKI